MRITFFVTPDQAHVGHNTDAPVIAIKAMERGYFPIYTRASVEQLNHGKFSPAVLDAAVIASMFGWHVPGAKAARDYIEQAEAAEAKERDDDARHMMMNIAKTYAVRVKESVTEQQWELIREQNRDSADARCASHIYCDAAALMLACMRDGMKAARIDYDPLDPAWTELWNAAERHAKTNWLTRKSRSKA